MATLRFETPLLSRNPSNVTNGYPLREYNRRGREFRELMLDSNRVQACLVLDTLGNARLLGDPENCAVNGATSFLLANICNKYLAVARAEEQAYKHWIGVAPWSMLKETNWAIFG